MPGIKLFVDDKRYAPEGWRLVRSISEAQRVLFQGVVEEISFDHDIMWNTNPGFELDEPAWFESYSGIAYFLALLPQNLRPVKVNLHTGNRSAGDHMEETLKAAGYIVTRTKYGI